MSNAMRPNMGAISRRLRREKDVKAARNKLLKTALSDSVNVFIPNAEEEDPELVDFDAKPYMSNPSEFLKLPHYKQVAVVEANKQLLSNNWKKLTLDEKRFAFWYAYGSHGVRDGFPDKYDYFSQENQVSEEKVSSGSDIKKTEAKTETELDQLINTITPSSTTVEMASRAALQSEVAQLDASKINFQKDVPLDLPFKYPSILKSALLNPPPETMTKRLPALDPRSFGIKRLAQYKQDRLMNPINKIVLVVCVFLTVLCFKQDRRVNVTGKVPEYPWLKKDEVTKESQNDRASDSHSVAATDKVDETEVVTSGKKWYYLWLR